MPSARILKTLNDHHDPALEDKQVAKLASLLNQAKISDQSPLIKAIFLIQRIKNNDLQRQIHNLCDQLDASDKELKAAMLDGLKLRGTLAKQTQKKQSQRKPVQRKKGRKK